MMLYRKNDALLDFDLAKVIEQSRDNPVFYVQYAHARGHSIFRKAREVFPNLPRDRGGRGSRSCQQRRSTGSTDPGELVDHAQDRAVSAADRSRRAGP